MRAFAVFLRLLFLSCLCAHSFAWAAPPTRAELPSALRPWVDWVLAAHPEAGCPVRFDEDRRECLWPGRLMLQATALGVSFVQRVEVAAPGRMALPGGPGLWPQQLSVDNAPATVVETDGRPVVALPAGEHRIAGWIPWPRMPDAIPIPPATGLVSLTIDGEAVAAPRWRDGRLWLRERKTVAPPKDTPADRLRMTVQRLLADGHPALLTTELSLTVTGSAREIVAGRPVPEGFTPLRIESKLPARLEADGRLRLQVRPGTWDVRVIAHRVGEPGSPGMTSQPAPWPEEETWAFAASPTDRLVRIRGVAQVDPRRTTSPQAWHRWPTYRLTPGDELDIETLRRGNPQPDPDQLSLDRTLWLDFDGGGYTLRDRIRGQLNRTWRMSTAATVELGRVSLDGEPQFITLVNDRRGVEVRQGRLSLVADARLPRDGESLPASGWGVTMQSASAELYTPPGWRVLMVGGVDAAPGAWLSAWTLFDLFFVLLSTIAAARLWGIGWAAVTLVGLALVWQEPEAPRLVWLGVMAVAALRRLVPAQARFAGTLRGLWFVAWLVLVLQVLPFAVTQARLAFYPQLENTRSLPDPLASRAVQPERAREVAAGKAMPQAAPSSAYGLPSAQDSLAAPSPPPPAPEPIDQADPGAVVQTGPGLPDWTWRRTALSWNGPVAPEQTLTPWLLAPAAVSALRVLALGLLAALAWRMFDRARTGTATPNGSGPKGAGLPGADRTEPAAGPQDGTPPAKAAPAAALLLAVAAALALPPSAARAQEAPSQALLDELARRLLEPEHAAPRAALPMMSIRIADDTAIADLQVHALQRTAVPLPVDASDDWPLAVALDGRGDEAPVLRASDGRLWILVPEGRHLVSIRQRLTGRDALAMPVPLRIQRVTFGADGWAIAGLNADGVPGERIVLTRRRAAQEPDASQPAPTALEPGELPALVRVTRTLSLGLQWRVTTDVQRLSPPGRALTVNVPLLPGEAVTTPGIVHDDDSVRVVMAAGTRGVRWQGTLDPVSALTLSAPASPAIVETWRIDVGPIWHLEHEGLAPIHHQDGRARWLPTWHPWPGESLALTLSRPEGAGGRTLTIDASRLTLTPGAQQLRADLALTLRTSQGRRHPITLPDGAQLQWVRIDGLAQPLQLDGRVLTLPLDPGERRVELRWQQPQSLGTLWRTPTVDLGVESVNARLTVETPASRWLVWLDGPRLGPAVLFWGVLVVVVALAVALSRAGRGVLPLGLAGWLLLGIGLMQTSLFAVLPLLGWLVLLQVRGRHGAKWHPIVFNLAQLAIVVLTVLVAAVLYFAVQQSLLGWPDMQIEGNGSSWRELHWYADRSGPVLPDALLVSLPMLAYRVLMLLWALWLAFTVLGWLRWAWPRFGTGGFWRAVGWSDLRRRPSTAPGAAE